MITNPNQPLLNELRWFIQQRWAAGIAVILFAAASSIWLGWTPRHAMICGVGAGIIAYNIVFWGVLRRAPNWLDHPKARRGMAWAQIMLDLACLTTMVVVTDGVLSPLLGLFVLHMIFASLLLQPPWYASYLVWTIAIVMVGAAFILTGLWPETVMEQVVGLGWAGTLLMTVYFTSHITNIMRDSQDHTRAVFEAAADGILTVDHRGGIVMANPEAVRQFGYTPAGLRGVRFDQLVSMDHGAQSQGRRLDGTVFPVEVSISAMGHDHEEARTVVIRDITEREHTEAKLHELNNALIKHQLKLVQQEKMVAVGQMAAGIAHEISNPLANMDGLIQVIQRKSGPLTPETTKKLREQISRINLIIRQLKDFAHPTETDRQTLPVQELIRSATDMIRFDPRHGNISITPSTSAAECAVRVHPQSMQQVLVNVIINALDATADRDAPRVTISAECHEGESCRIVIADNGAGMSAEQLDQAFEPFYTTKELGKGTGLGLSISYTLVNREGGSMSFTSTLGEGTTLTITLPLHEP